ncbi:MAG: hypothetical protein CO030_04690 [Candidatus Magasanikbacteria bacterium CG_4_9_14_0_2_um_filter_42_11]|uniref:Uncharacterized protein n=1 Tax=Candidatus Magasanikbacteria bacterium CG_4_9_14_0_2_um_filter_42_11 TaxID=1974643 RepID=A0A2M8F8N9_9BACT|nr:MAG: hypothetical protein COU34_01745 [Candidatus Magasanikbacteria bacterium CG10_big_fil_rev_8_21_14_0_10_43_9]PIY92582.1 MAG: hypothetical protein COY70_02470 [Candidatus Magasanikbacteria bacterium CG_4_10_14_0_8_um_filter_42_12]PJC52091.1 MAG: hypothetical protein CO030_04690 [Candidatus Magasanikbacteria bacterium CG_4_9_14_0_2_um_filter_42_11]
MKIPCIGQYAQHPRMIMQRCGYGEIVNKKGQRSYVKLLRGVPYPRFHAYIDVLDDGFQINVHLDQKAPVYKSVSAHAGEYDGAVVEREAARISATVEQFRQ